MTDERRRRTAWRLAAAGAAASALCLVVAVAALWLRPRQFTTHRDAIGYALAQRGLGYQAIHLNHAWPDTVNDLAYGAGLDVELAGGRHVSGRLECRSGRTGCYFSLSGLGIVREPLPELVRERDLPPWAAWAERQWSALASAAQRGARSP